MTPPHACMAGWLSSHRLAACMHPQDDYQSGAIHHVILGAAGGGPLQPGTEYFYSCGDPALGMSGESSFRTPPATGPESFPYRWPLLPGRMHPAVTGSALALDTPIVHAYGDTAGRDPVSNGLVSMRLPTDSCTPAVLS